MAHAPRNTDTARLGRFLDCSGRISAGETRHLRAAATNKVPKQRTSDFVCRSQTKGTHALKREIALSRTDDRLERARANSKQPKALRKMSRSLKGRVQSTNTIEAVRRAARRPRSKAWKKKMAAYWRRRGHPPGHPERRFWTRREDALLGTASDAAIARKIRRSLWAVYLRRRKLGIPPFRRQGEPRRRRKSAARS